MTGLEILTWTVGWSVIVIIALVVGHYERRHHDRMERLRISYDVARERQRVERSYWHPRHRPSTGSRKDWS